MSSKTLMVYLIIFGLVSLWPFDFLFLKFNNARLMETTGGIELSDQGQVLSLSSTEGLYQRMISGSGFSLETWVAPKNVVQFGPARIVSYSLNPYLRNFTLAQSKKKLVMRLRTTKTDLNGTNPHVEVDNVFISPKIYHISVTYDFFHQNIYIDGKLTASKKLPGGRFTNWNSSYYLVLGNEATGDRPWLGKIFSVAIYNRPLSEQEIGKNYRAGWFVKDNFEEMDQRVSKGLVAQYSFRNKNGKIIFDGNKIDDPLNLHIPKVIWNYDTPFYKLFNLSLGENPKLFFEVVLHLIIFIPIGLIGYQLINEHLNSFLKTFGLVFILGALMAFSIESLQHFLPTRHATLLDFSSHILGLILGITIGKVIPLVA